MTHKFKQQSEKWRLSMNVDKTKYLYVRSTSGNSELEEGEKYQVMIHSDTLKVVLNSGGRD